MRNTFARTLYEMGAADPTVYIVVADISPAGSMSQFRDEFPERFINVGVAEQSMIGICAGLALRGMRPFAYTIATFAFYRCFEMVRDDLCYQKLPVTVVGIGGGVSYSTLGGTHHAQEDVSIASAIPNMTVLAPCDPAEAGHATRYCATQTSGPVYLRMGKAGEPDLTAKAVEPFTFGRLRYIRRGSHVCVLGYGPSLKIAADVADGLERTGVSVSLVSAHTLKPLDRAGVVGLLSSHRQVVVVEECSPFGGLGARVKEIAWDVQAKCEIRTFSLKDEFIHFYGSHTELLREHGLDPARILREISERREDGAAGAV